MASHDGIDVGFVCYANNRSKMLGDLSATVDDNHSFDSGGLQETTSGPLPDIFLEYFRKHPAYDRLSGSERKIIPPNFSSWGLVLTADGFLKSAVQARLGRRENIFTVLEFLAHNDPITAEAVAQREVGYAPEYDIDDSAAPASTVAKRVFGGEIPETYSPVFVNSGRLIPLSDIGAVHEAELGSLVKIADRVPVALANFHKRIRCDNGSGTN